MGAPKGNKNALGNKGGGRSRAVDLKRLLALWNGQIEMDDLKVHYDIDRGIIGNTPFDDLAWKILKHEDQNAKQILMNKLFPRPVIRKVVKVFGSNEDRTIQDIIDAHTPDLLR